MGFANDKFGNPIWIPDDGFMEGSIADVSDESMLQALAGPEIQVNVAPDYTQQAIDAVSQIGQTRALPGAPAPVASGAPPDLSQNQNVLIPPGAGGPPSDLPIPGQGAGGTGTNQSLPPQASSGGPVDPYQQAPVIFPSAPGALAPGDVVGAQRQQQGAFNDSVALEAQAADAAHAAEQAKVDRVAQVGQDYANAVAANDQSFQAARQAIRAEKEAETAQWMRDLDRKAKEEPDPSRWFESKSAFGKIAWLLSLAFGAKAAASAPGVQNIGLQMIQQEMAQDVANQKARLQREYETLQKKGGQIDAKFMQRYQDAQDDHKMLAERWQIVMQSNLTRANGPGDQDLRKRYAESAAHAGEQVLAMAAKSVDTAVQQKEHQLNRSQQAWIAKMNDKRDRDLKAAELQNRVDLAKIDASLQMGKANAAAKGSEKPGDFPVLDSQASGITVVDSKGQKIGNGFKLSKDRADKVVEMNQAAQDKYDALVRVRDKMKQYAAKGQTLDIMLKSDPTLISDIKKLGYGGAKTNDPRGIVTDKDLVNGMESELGADLDSWTGRLKVGFGIVETAKIYDMLDRNAKDFKPQMDKKFGQFMDKSLPEYSGDARVDWTPTNATAPTPTPAGAHRTLTEAGISNRAMKIDSRESLAEAEKADKLSPGALPPYSKPEVGTLVQTNIQSMSKVGPLKAREIAEATIDAVRSDDRAYYETVRAADKAVERAEKALTEITRSPKSPSQIAKEALQKYGIQLTGEEMQAYSEISKGKR